VRWTCCVLFGLVVGCRSPPETPVSLPEPVVRSEVLFADAAQALESAEIELIQWGLTPYLDPEILQEYYRPILSYVELRLGVPIVLIVGQT